LAAGFFANPAFISMSIPLLIVYGFLGLREILVWARWERMVYAVSIVLAGMLILQSQVTFSAARSTTIQNSIDENRELLSIAIWLKANTKGEAVVVAGKLGIIGYYSDLSVTTPDGKKENAQYAVSTALELEGYERVFTPTGEGPAGVLTGKSHYSVWERK